MASIVMVLVVLRNLVRGLLPSVGLVARRVQVLLQRRSCGGGCWGGEVSEIIWESDRLVGVLYDLSIDFDDDFNSLHM